MSEIWKTKWGARRVRHDPPTLAEAFAAAACLTEDRQEQAEIAAALMGVPVAAALAEAGRLARDERSTISVSPSSRDKARPRTVVIERRPARRLASVDRAQDPLGPGPIRSGSTLRLPSGSRPTVAGMRPR